MADPTPAAAAPAVLATTTAPKGFLPLSRLPRAAWPAPGDLLFVSQLDPGAAAWASRAGTFAQLAAAGRPPTRHAVDAASAVVAPGDSGLTLDPAAGDFAVALPPVAAALAPEVAFLHVGAGGVATLVPAPGEAILRPDGAGGTALAALPLRPAETVRLRAVALPAPARSGWYLVSV